METTKLTKLLDNYLCNSRYLNLELELSHTSVRLVPYKVNFLVTFYKGSVISDQSYHDDLNSALNKFKEYSEMALNSENTIFNTE